MDDRTGSDAAVGAGRGTGAVSPFAGITIDPEHDFLYGVRDIEYAVKDDDLQRRISSGELKVRQKDGCLYLYKRREETDHGTV